MAISRRDLGKLLGSAAIASTVPTLEAEAPKAVANHAGRSFPEGFLWGSATASYQVEGAVKEGGRGVSIWDTFAHTPGKVDSGDTGDVADDFYHRFPQDIALMKELGLKTCRFSIAWPRIFPNGTGQPNQAGIDFYRRLADALLAAGIEPYATLYHWDLPQTLQDKGGWQNRDTAKAFAEYAGYTAGKLSDRVKHFMTMNEMRTFVEVGYQSGRHAPGLKLGRKDLAQLTHHVVLGHGLGVQAVRAHAQKGTLVGLAENVSSITPAIEAPEHIEAARKAMREDNTMYLGVILDGNYTDHYLQKLGADAPQFTAEDLRAISTPMDFVGVNVYTASYVRAADNELGYAHVPMPKSYPHMLSPWLNIGPEALYWVPKLVNDLWKPKALFITENGASSADTVNGDGHVYDMDRVMYLRNYLGHLQRAVAEGVPVKGYFLWSLLDNFEWADGYAKRFGIIYVDFKTQKRTPKLSADFYKEVIRRNALA
ncbi:GH1 family beta-glucosidase [Granulicella cerasi]|uniref:Beta-glucosidase n=1 Tax=Granulicella cerasi TaxID=741063 RepID=A0ABW1Z7C5_9BACT|nr:GH1 family beta-glucosidase [Granulicella cerasi]